MKNIAKILGRYLFPGRIMSRIRNSSNKIAITFDDGPHPANTRRLLEALRREGAKATFFVTGTEAEKYPELIREIRENDHEIGNHSYSHKRIAEIGLDEYAREVVKTSELLENPAFFRPPYGEMTLPMLRFLEKANLQYVGWSLDSMDSYIRDEKRLIESMEKRAIKSGDIVLFHEDYSTTIGAIPEILRGLKMRGFTMTTISEMKS